MIYYPGIKLKKKFNDLILPKKLPLIAFDDFLQNVKA